MALKDSQLFLVGLVGGLVLVRGDFVLLFQRLAPCPSCIGSIVELLTVYIEMTKDEQTELDFVIGQICIMYLGLR